MSARQGVAGVFRIQGTEPAATAECTDLSCDLAAVASDPGAVTALVIAGVVAFVALAYVRDAKADCRDERRRVLDERAAFEEFSDRVSGFDPAPASSTASSFGGPAAAVRTGYAVDGGSRTDDVRLRRVLAAYRDTVMSLPHYREEYDETIPESLAAELGPDTAAALASNGTLSSGAQSALVRRSRRAADARSSLAEAIDSEIDALSRYESDLTRIDRRRRRLLEHLDGVEGDRTGAAIDIWQRLDDLEDDCEEAASERQRALDDPPMTVEAPGEAANRRSFHEYLYGSTEGPSHPVLAQIAEITERLRTDRDRVASRVAGGK